MRKYLMLSVAVNCILFVTAQVEVRNEPRHHNVFENEFVRILDVHLGPGDTSLYHLHNTPSVFIVFTDANVGSQLWGKQSQKGTNVSGEVSYDSIHTPRTHRVWNDDTTWFHVMDIELTNKTKKINVTTIKDPALKLLFNEQQVNGYHLTLKAGKNLRLPGSARGYLLVSKAESTIEFESNNVIQNRIIKPSHYIWIEANKSFSIKNMDIRAGNFVLLQLK